MNVYTKLADARDIIAKTELKKQGKNEFSHYEYYSPEQVIALVQDANNKVGLINVFSLKKDELGIYGELKIVDTDNGDWVEFIGVAEVPDIKATNITQKYGGCYTYINRYLLMLAYNFADCELNSLDFDTTEQTKKANEQKKETKTQLQPFTNENLDKLTKQTDKYKTAEDAIAEIKKHYTLDAEMETKVKELYKSLDAIKK